MSEKLQEATIKALTDKLQEANHEDKNIEDQLDKIYDNLVTEILKEFPDATSQEYNWESQGYKHRLDISIPDILIKEGVSRHILIDIFYAIPSFPTYSYYLGASAEIVEVSSNKTSVAGINSDGYTIKNEIPNCEISIEGYAGNELKNKGQNIEDFIKVISDTYFNLRNYNIKRFI